MGLLHTVRKLVYIALDLQNSKFGCTTLRTTRLIAAKVGPGMAAVPDK